MEALSPPNTVYLHVTKKCNLHCRYCYFDAGEPMDNELTTEDLLAVLEDIYSLKPARIVFTGGEPLMREDILLTAARSKNIDNSIISCISTNGVLVKEKNVEQIISVFDEIRISIDGFANVNDNLRGKGSYEKAIEALKIIRRSGGDPIAFITVTSLNYPYIIDFIKYLMKIDIFNIHISPIRIKGRAKDDVFNCDFDKMLNDVREFFRLSFGMQFNSKKKETNTCGVGKYFTIYPDGSVYPCHLLTFPEFYLGNAITDKISTIYYGSSLMNRLRQLKVSEVYRFDKINAELPSTTKCLGVFAQDHIFRKQLFTYLDNI